MRNGRRASTNSWRMNVGAGSRSQVFGAEDKIVRHNSSSVTGLKMDKPQMIATCVNTDAFEEPLMDYL